MQGGGIRTCGGNSMRRGCGQALRWEEDEQQGSLSSYTLAIIHRVKVMACEMRGEHMTMAVHLVTVVTVLLEGHSLCSQGTVMSQAHTLYS